MKKISILLLCAIMLSLLLTACTPKETPNDGDGNKLPAVSTLAEAMDLAAKQNGNVNHGYLDVTTGSTLVSVIYEITEGYFSYRTYSNGSTSEYLYYLDGDSVWSVENTYGTAGPNSFETSKKDLDGYHVDSSFMNYVEDFPGAYGIIDFVNTIYEMSETGINYKDNSKDGKFGFSYTTALSGYGYEIDLSFTLDEEEGFIDELTVDVDIYIPSDTTVTYKNDEDGIPTDEIESITYAEGSEPFFNNGIVWTQGTGFAGINQIYAPEKHQIADYTLSTVEVEDYGYYVNVKEGSEKEVTGTVDAILNTNTYFLLSDFLPAGVGTTFETVKITAPVVNEDGETVYEEIGYFNKNTNMFGVKFDTIGEHSIRVTTSKTVKDVTLNVDYAKLTEFNAGEDIKAYVNESVEFNPVVNSNANSAFTAEIVGGTANAVIDENCRFIATEAGEYTVKLTSAVDPSKSDEVKVTVSEFNIDIAPLLSGKYTAAGYEVTFTPDSNGATKGTLLVIANKGNAEYEQSATFKYEFKNYALDLTPVNVPDNWHHQNVKISSDFKSLTIGTFTLKKAAESDPLEAVVNGIKGDWTATDADGKTYYMTINVWDDGTVSAEIKDIQGVGMGQTIGYYFEFTLAEDNFGGYAMTATTTEDYMGDIGGTAFTYTDEMYVYDSELNLIIFVDYNTTNTLEFTKAE